MDLQVTLGPGPRRAQLEQQLRDGVRTGRLRPGTRLPRRARSPRELGVSRGVVVEAYAQLVAEGYLVARRGAGTRVAPAPSGRPGDQRRRPTAPGAAEGSDPADCEGSDPGLRFDLRTGRVDLSLFPRRAWLAATARALRELPDAAFDYGDPRGHEPLRDALAAHLGRARGVLADPDADRRVRRALPGRAGPVARARAARRAARRDRGPGLARAAADRRARRPRGRAGPGRRARDRRRARSATSTRSSSRPRTSSRPASSSRPSAAPSSSRGRASATRSSSRTTTTPSTATTASRSARSRASRPTASCTRARRARRSRPALRLGWLLAPDWLAGDARRGEGPHRPRHAGARAGRARRPARPRRDRPPPAPHAPPLPRPPRRARRRARASTSPQASVGGAAAGLHVVAWLPDDADEAAHRRARPRERGVAVHAPPRPVHGRRAPQPPALLLGYAATPEPSLARAAKRAAATRATSRVARSAMTVCERPGPLGADRSPARRRAARACRRASAAGSCGRDG